MILNHYFKYFSLIFISLFLFYFEALANDNLLKKSRFCCDMAFQNSLDCEFERPSNTCQPMFNTCNICNEAYDGSDTSIDALKYCCKNKKECKLINEDTEPRCRVDHYKQSDN